MRDLGIVVRFPDSVHPLRLPSLPAPVEQIGRSPVGLWLLWLLLCLPWFCALPGVYLFDDYITPLTDPASQGLGDFFRQLGVTIRPLTKLTYSLEATLGLDAVDVRRGLQILVHAGNAALFCCLVRRIGARPATDPLVLAATGIYLLHPIQAEKVLAIAGRPTLLMEGFLLAAVLAALDRRFLVSSLLFVGSILARETAVCFLPLFLILYAPAGKRQCWQLLAPALLVACLLLTIPRYRDLASFSFAGLDLGASCLRQVSAIPVGLSLYGTPWRLSIDHGEALAARISDPLFLAGVAILGLLVVLAILPRFQTPVRAGAGWMVAALLPTQSCIPKIDALTERPFALALAGFLLLIVAVWGSGSRTRSGQAATILLLAALPVAAVFTGQRALLYRDELAIWQDAMAKSATNIRPHLNFATLLLDAGRVEEARAALLAADAIHPFDPDLLAKLRRIHYQQLLKESAQ